MCLFSFFFVLFNRIRFRLHCRLCETSAILPVSLGLLNGETEMWTKSLNDCRHHISRKRDAWSVCLVRTKRWTLIVGWLRMQRTDVCVCVCPTRTRGVFDALCRVLYRDFSCDCHRPQGVTNDSCEYRRLHVVRFCGHFYPDLLVAKTCGMRKIPAV